MPAGASEVPVCTRRRPSFQCRRHTGIPSGVRRPRERPEAQLSRPTFMSDELLTAAEAARRLGITVTTFYDWLGRSRIGELEIRGQRVTIDFLQGGPRGQGRIRVEVREVERVRELMRVRPQTVVVRPPPIKRTQWPGIHVPLGRPR